MTPRTKSRACTTAAVLLLACAITTADWQPLLAITELAAACLLHTAGRSYQRQHETAQAAERLARPFPDPAPIPEPQPRHGHPLTPAEHQALDEIEQHLQEQT